MQVAEQGTDHAPYLSPEEGFTLAELTLAREDFDRLAMMRSQNGALRPATRRWLACWFINQHAFFAHDPQVLAAARLAHYLGWCLGGRDSYDHAR